MRSKHSAPGAAHGEESLKYQINRDGKQYGPYSLKEIRNYVGQGSVVTSDLARGEESQSWVQVMEVLAEPGPLPNPGPPAPGLNGVHSGVDPVPASPNLGAAPTQYFIQRGGSQFGPYSLSDVRKYVAQGSLALTDLGRKDAPADWTQLATLLAGAGDQPQAGNLRPPELHWAVAVLLHMFTLGLFGPVWLFGQSNWVKKIDPQSKATRNYATSLLLAVIAPFAFAMVLGTFVTASAGDRTAGAVPPALIVYVLFMSGLAVLAIYFLVAVLFNIKKSLEHYYNSTEPIGLRLSGGMLLFFNIFYIQYHFTRIAEWKRTGMLRA